MTDASDASEGWKRARRIERVLGRTITLLDRARDMLLADDDDIEPRERARLVSAIERQLWASVWKDDYDDER